MKIVVTSDLHADRTTLGVSRLPEVAKAMKDAVDFAIEEKVDLFLNLGDIGDPDNGGASYQAIELAIETAGALSYRGIDSVWIAGNHDVFEDGTGKTTLSPLKCFSRSFVKSSSDGQVIVAEQPCMLDFKDRRGITLGCLPYAPVSHAYDPEAAARDMFIQAAHKDRIIIAAHLSIAGVVPGEETTEMPRGREVLFPIEQTSRAMMRLCGHYHHRQTTKEGIIIPGSLARLTFADENCEPGFLLLDV